LVTIYTDYDTNLFTDICIINGKNVYTADTARNYPPSLRSIVVQSKEKCDKDPVCLGFSRQGGKSKTDSS